MSVEKENEKRWKLQRDALAMWAEQFPDEKHRQVAKHKEINKQREWRKKIDSYKQKGLYKTDNEENRLQGSHTQEIVDPEEKYKKIDIVGWVPPRSPLKETNRMQNVNRGGKSRAKSRKYNRRSTRKKSSRRNRKYKKSRNVKK